MLKCCVRPFVLKIVDQLGRECRTLLMDKHKSMAEGEKGQGRVEVVASERATDYGKKNFRLTAAAGRGGGGKWRPVEKQLIFSAKPKGQK